MEYIQILGGSCSIYGYKKNFAALEFHHFNPSDKDFQLDSRRLSNTNMESIKQELKKCILLCANCHRELHNPSLENVF